MTVLKRLFCVCTTSYEVCMPATTYTHRFYKDQRQQLRDQNPEFLKNSKIHHMNVKDNIELQERINKPINKEFLIHCMTITNDVERSHDEKEKLRLTYRIFQDGLISIPTYREAQSLDP